MSREVTSLWEDVSSQGSLQPESHGYIRVSVLFILRIRQDKLWWDLPAHLCTRGAAPLVNCNLDSGSLLKTFVWTFFPRVACAIMCVIEQFPGALHGWEMLLLSPFWFSQLWMACLADMQKTSVYCWSCSAPTLSFKTLWILIGSTR